MWKEETSTEAPTRQVHSIKRLHTVRESYSRTSTNGHLSTTAIFSGGHTIHWLLLNPLYNGHFFGGRPYIDSCLNLSTTATFFAGIAYIDSCLNLSTAATFFCPHGGRCREAQLYRPPNVEKGDSPLTPPLQPNP